MNELPASTQLQAWNAQPNEPSNCYSAFRVYLELGARRTQAAVIEATGISKNTINKWATEYNWDERVAAYENALMQAKFSADRSILVTYQTQVVQTALEDYDLMRKRWREIMDQDGEHLSPNQLSTMVAARATMDTIARRAVQLPNAYKEQDQKYDPTKDAKKDLDWVGDGDDG